MRTFWSNFRLLFDRRDLGHFLFLVLLMLGGTCLELASLGAVPLFVASLSGQSIGGAMADVSRWLGVEKLVQQPLSGGLLLGALFLIRTLYVLGCNYVQERVLNNREIALSSRLFKAYMGAPYSFHLHRNSSQIITNVQNEVERIVTSYLAACMNIMRGGIIILTVVGLLLWYDPFISLLAFAALGICGGGFMMAMNRRISHWGWVAHLRRQETVKCIGEGIGAYKEAQILGRKRYFCSQLHQALREKAYCMMMLRLEQKSLWPFMELITVCVLLGTMCVMLLRGDGKELVAPSMALLAVCLARLKGSLTEFMLEFSNVKGVSSVLEALCKDLRFLEGLPQQDEQMPDMPFDHEIVMDDVSYRYDGAEKTSLEHVSFHLKRGRSLALVGPSGGGKTTLVSVLLGLLSPDDGYVSVDGEPIANRLCAWQRHIGYVAQDIFLLDDTIRANIAMGIEPQAVDETALQRAISAAQLDEFLSELPEGDRTVLGEHGMRLSGGQRQRVAIARALYRNPQLLIFDEATSALDVLTEQAVVSAIERLRGSHTLVIVAHRLSTVRGCDQIAYLKEGRLLAMGTYDELKASVPDFRKMAEASELPSGREASSESEKTDRMD